MSPFLFLLDDRILTLRVRKVVIEFDAFLLNNKLINPLEKRRLIKQKGDEVFAFYLLRICLDRFAIQVYLHFPILFADVHLVAFAFYLNHVFHLLSLILYLPDSSGKRKAQSQDPADKLDNYKPYLFRQG